MKDKQMNCTWDEQEFDIILDTLNSTSFYHTTSSIFMTALEIKHNQPTQNFECHIGQHPYMPLTVPLNATEAFFTLPSINRQRFQDLKYGYWRMVRERNQVAEDAAKFNTEKREEIKKQKRRQPLNVHARQ